jgi:hypothetical protein
MQMPDVLIVGSTNEPTSPPSSNGENVIEVVNRLLGYDIEQQRLMAQGYRESAEESLVIAESNLAASVETLPDDEEPA